MKIISSLFAAAALIGAASTPAVAGITPKGTIEGIQPVSNKGYEAFKTFAVEIASFGGGPDGHYQMVMNVKNKGSGLATLTASDFVATLLNDKNESRKSWGEIYDGNAIGPAGSFPPIQETIKLGPGEQRKIKLGFPGSKGFAPKFLVLEEVARGKVKYAISD